jgi:hypothetical protein
MSEQSTPARPFFQPRPECDSLQTAYLLWKLAGRVEVRESGCWEWVGALTTKGYGHFTIGGRGQNQTKLVHRTVYQLCIADTSEKLLVCHHCDNPACCRPDHLFLGTHAQNLQDATRKGRLHGSGVRGERHGQARFTEDQVRDIRKRASSGGPGIQAQLAREYHCERSYISKIVRRVWWAHVSDEPEGGAT